MTPADPRPKFAILSNDLPPSHSGQAVVLDYLLSGFAPDEYCLISTTPYPSDVHSAAFYHLSAGQTILSPLLRRFPKVNPDKDTPFHRAFRPLLKGYQRLRGNALLDDGDRLLDDLTRQLQAVLEREPCDTLVVCPGMPHEMLAAYRACQASGTAFVPYIFDYFGLRYTGGLREYALCYEGEMLRGAAAIIVPNEFMGQEYKRLYGVESTIVRNPCRLPDLDRLDDVPPVLPTTTFNIVYTGAIYHAHYDAFRNLIAAVERQGREDVAIHVFTAQLPVTLQQAGLKAACFHIHGYVDHAEVSALQRQADVLFLPLAFESAIPETIKTSSPGKLGEYLSMGRPILVHTPQDSFVSWYFKTHACGLVVDENDPAVLAEALARLLNNADLRAELGARARTQAAEFAVETVGPHFRAVLEGLRRPETAPSSQG
jgi:glycosyltransferase involved in cell wall biosynthesis